MIFCEHHYCQQRREKVLKARGLLMQSLSVYDRQVPCLLAKRGRVPLSTKLTGKAGILK